MKPPTHLESNPRPLHPSADSRTMTPPGRDDDMSLDINSRRGTFLPNGLKWSCPFLAPLFGETIACTIPNMNYPIIKPTLLEETLARASRGVLCSRRDNHRICSFYLQKPTSTHVLPSQPCLPILSSIIIIIAPPPLLIFQSTFHVALSNCLNPLENPRVSPLTLSADHAGPFYVSLRCRSAKVSAHQLLGSSPAPHVITPQTQQSLSQATLLQKQRDQRRE